MAAAGYPGPCGTDKRWDEFDHLALLQRYVDPARVEPALAGLAGVPAPPRRGPGGVDPRRRVGGVHRRRAGRPAGRGARRLPKGRDAVVVSSGGVIGALAAGLLGAPAATGIALNRVAVNGAITLVTVGGRGANLLSFNDHAHFAGRPPGTAHLPMTLAGKSEQEVSHESRPADRIPPGLRDRRGAGTGDHRAHRRDRPGRGRRLLSHRHPHLGRPVRRGLEGAGIGLPFTPGHETAGWVARGRLRRSRTSPSATPCCCHPLVTCGYCHFCRAGDDMHCTDSVFPGVVSLRAGSPSTSRPTRARSCRCRPGVTPVDVGPLGCAGMTAYGAVKKALPYAYPGSYTVAFGRGRAGPHRHPGPARAVPDRDHRRRPQRRRWSTPAAGAPTRPCRRRPTARTCRRSERQGEGPGRGRLRRRGRRRARRRADARHASGVDFMVGYGGRLDGRRSSARGCSRRPASSAASSAPTTRRVELVALVARGA